MFVGHYGFSYGLKKVEPSVPLWVLFLAVQLLDLVWAPLVLLGVEKVRIVPHFTASNSIDLYYMPYTHGFVTALWWSAVAYVVYRALDRHSTVRGAFVVSLAVFSHWVLDLVVHVHDLPLWNNQWKVGFGLWKHAGWSFAAEALVLAIGIAIYLRAARIKPWPTVVFGVVMLGILLWTRLGKAPQTDRAFAISAIVSYIALAFVAWLLERTARPAHDHPLPA
jgi:hypothetical protein